MTKNDVELLREISPNIEDFGYLEITGERDRKGRVVPLNYKASLALQSYLDSRYHASAIALFANRFGKELSPRGVEKIVNKYFVQANIHGTTVRTLRHTFGTQHVIKGTSLKTIQEAMGFKDIGSVAIYVSLAKEVMKKEIQDHAL